MASPKIDKDTYLRNIKSLYKKWTSLENIDAVVVCVGTTDDVFYAKSVSLQIWLFGYELTDTLMVFLEDAIYFLASKKKLDFLRPIVEIDDEESPKVNLVTRQKTDNEEEFKKLVDLIKDSRRGSKIGIFTKEEFGGNFYPSSVKSVFNKFDKEDFSLSFAQMAAVKHESELELLRKASSITCNIFNQFIKEQLMDIIDNDKRVKHVKFSQMIEKATESKEYILNVHPDDLETCYPPIVQSGDSFNLKYSVQADSNKIHFGSIIIMFGARYKHYCSNLVRTMLVNPTEDQQQTYVLVVAVQDEVISMMRPGVLMSSLWDKAVSVVKESKQPHLVDKLTKNLGFVIGIEFRESTMVINSKNSTTLEPDMTVVVNVGLSDVKNKQPDDDSPKTYAIYVGDVVKVNKEGPPTLLTSVKKKVKNVSIILKEEDDDEDKENAQEDYIRGRAVRSTVLEQRTRMEETNEDKRKEKQKSLAERINEDAKQRILEHKGQKDKTQTKRKNNVSYKTVSLIPKDPDVRSMRIFVDKRYETVILPVFGLPTPFHISNIKNVSMSVEGEYTYLRVNFFFPGQTMSKDADFTNPNDNFVKELTYRSVNVKKAGELASPAANLNTALRLIKDVQKNFKTREAEAREKEGIVKQDTLVLSTGKGNPKLKEMYIRPNILSKRIQGSLEAHTNGFRFTSLRGDKVDILYNNIKHSIFQSCDHELIILIHFHLKNAILFGKKRHLDVQFYTEVGEITTDLAKHGHLNDRDDLYAEQQERELRHKLKVGFKSFMERVESVTKGGIEFETMFRELSFFGVPNRSTVRVTPTSSCLVQLTEWPPFIISLDEIELFHFERVSFSLKNFDMVFIFKDYFRKVVQVSSIPMSSLDQIKEWLNSCDMKYSEGIQSLNWVKIMKTITDDPEGFFLDGGWSFLQPDSDDEGGDSDDSEEADENWEISGEDSGSDLSDDDEDDSDFNSSGVTEDDDDDEVELSSSEESGMSWDELEKEAAIADKEQAREEETIGHSQKHSSKSSSKPVGGRKESDSKNHRDKSSKHGFKRASTGDHSSSAKKHKKR